MDANRTVSVFESLSLGQFPDEWVKACWDNDFADLTTLPAESEALLTETGYLIEELKAAEEVIITWLESNNQNESGEGFWSILVENEISHKSLVAILAYLINSGGKVSAGFTERAAGIISASVYLRLIALPGSSAFKIYTPELFLQACRILSKWNKSACGGKKKRKRGVSSPKLSQSSGVTKRGKRQKRSNETSVESEDGDKNEQQEEIVDLSVRELQELDNLMTGLLQAVLAICETYSLRQSELTAIQLMSVLIGVTRMNPELITENMGQWDSKICSPGILAYKAVFLMCQPFHGHVTVLISEVCKQLLNHLLMLEDGKQFQSLVHMVLLMRSQALNFIKYLCKEFGERSTLSIKTLIQHLCCKVPDRAEYRTHTAQVVSELLCCLPDLEYAKLLEWLKKLSKQKKVSQRSFVIEVILVLLDKPERKLSAEVPEDLADFTTHKSMVCTMLSRCSDSNASVRSRALVGFSSCTSSKHLDIINTLKEIITPVATKARPNAKHFMPTPKLAIMAELGEDEDSTEKVTRKQQEVCMVLNQQKDKEHPFENVAESRNDAGVIPHKQHSKTPKVDQNKSFGSIELTPGFHPYLPDTEGVVSMFHRRALDTKVAVRKSAMQALQNVIYFTAPLYQEQDLAALQERCADPALSVRKQAVQSLFELLQAFPRDKQIQKAWIYGMLPQVMDRETSVQEKCFELLEEMILQNLKPIGKTQSSSIEWELLNIIVDDGCEKLRRYLQKACQHWSRVKKFKSSMIEALQSHVSGPNDQAAWMFLAEISKTPTKIKHDLVISHWKTVTQSIPDDAACSKWSNVLTVLGAIAKSVSPEAVGDLLDDMKCRLRQFSYPTPLIAGMVNCISKLHGCLEIDSSQRHLQAWGEEVMADCDKYISHVVLNAQSESVDEEDLIRYMFTLGEVCQRCPTRMPKRAALLIQSIVAAPCIGNSGDGDQGTQTKESGRNGPVDVLHDSGENQMYRNKGSQDSQESDSQANSQSSQSQASKSSQPLSQFRGSTMSSKLRAHAFITLGKLCLVDESLAKKSIAALARELEESDSPAVRNNVVIIMGDLTIRYTTLVDRYITNIAACLKDSSPLVRKNTLTILTRLLQEEYVKWKGILFFRYITTILDETLEIKNLAEFCLEHLLLQKQPTMFFHPFLECIFHFNNYQTHAVYNKFKQMDREKQKFSLAGKENTRRRMRLYLFMLEHMTDEQRFKTTDKINKEILSAIVDQVIPLDVEGAEILQDALSILSSKEIKLSTLRSKSVEDVGEEGADVAQIVTATAKKVLISQVVKRNVIENVVPVVISLKHMLEKKRSPLLKDLMGYLRELLKDYKNEVKDILAADRQLAQEIEFDLRNFENQESENAVAANRQMAKTPTVHSPGTPPVSRQSSRQPSRAGSPVVNLNPVLREATSVVNTDVHNRHELVAGKSSPVLAVPSSRRASTAIFDAAKKAMTRVELLRHNGSPFSPLTKDIRANQGRRSVIPKSSLSKHLKSLAAQDSENVDNSSMTPSRQNQQARAISTPTDGLYNITFGGDANVTMVPPSPIPSVASVINNGKLCLSPMLSVQRKGDKSVIHMPHPEAKESEPRKWNIKSPAAKRSAPEVNASSGDTPSRKAYTTSRAGLRRSIRHKKT